MSQPTPSQRAAFPGAQYGRNYLTDGSHYLTDGCNYLTERAASPGAQDARDDTLGNAKGLDFLAAAAGVYLHMHLGPRGMHMDRGHAYTPGATLYPERLARPGSRYWRQEGHLTLKPQPSSLNPARLSPQPSTMNAEPVLAAAIGDG